MRAVRAAPPQAKTILASRARLFGVQPPNSDSRGRGTAARFALPDHFAQIGGGTDFPRTELRARMLRDQVDGVIQVARLEDHDAAELLLGFSERPVGDD